MTDCEYCGEPLGDCSPACDRDLHETLRAAWDRVEREALLKASNLAAECEDAIEASSAIRSLANGWDCPDPWEAAIEKAEREARAEGRREGLREAAEVAGERENADNASAYYRRQVGRDDNYWCGGASAAATIRERILALNEGEDRDG